VSIDRKTIVLISFLSMFNLLLLLLCISIPSYIYAEDIKGLQPLQPYGVFSTFSAESLRSKELGIAIGIERARSPDFYRITTQAAYGLRDDMELHINIPYMLRYEQSIYGFEDLCLGFKHRVIDEGRYNPALAYLLMASPGIGNSEFTTDGRIGAGLIISKKVGPFRGHGNLLIYAPFRSGLNREYLLNLGAELAIAHSTRVLGELVGRKNYFINRIDLLEWRIGLRQEVYEQTFVTIGAGFDIKDLKPQYRLMLLLSYVIPTKKEPLKRVYE
jgi:hypothetical protein